MQGLGRQLKALAAQQLDIAAQLGQVEGDRAGPGDQYLVVGVAVLRVRVARPIAPFAGPESLAHEPGGEGNLPTRSSVTQATFTPITVPTPYVTAAAAAPMTTWRAP